MASHKTLVVFLLASLAFTSSERSEPSSGRKFRSQRMQNSASAKAGLSGVFSEMLGEGSFLVNCSQHHRHSALQIPNEDAKLQDEAKSMEKSKQTSQQIKQGEKGGKEKEAKKR